MSWELIDEVADIELKMATGKNPSKLHVFDNSYTFLFHQSLSLLSQMEVRHMCEGGYCSYGWFSFFPVVFPDTDLKLVSWSSSWLSSAVHSPKGFLFLQLFGTPTSHLWLISGAWHNNTHTHPLCSVWTHVLHTVTHTQWVQARRVWLWL